MNQKILRMYYEMQGKIIFPEAKEGNSNMELAATVAANFASIGYPMTTEQTKKLAQADKEDIVSFYRDNFEMLFATIGAWKDPKPFYPDFPEGCMKRSMAEYFVDQVVYGLSGLQIEPQKYQEEKKTFPFIGTYMRRILMEGSKEDLENTFKLAVSSTIAYSKEQREFIMEYAKENKDAVNVLLQNVDTKNRENAVTTAMMLESLKGDSRYTKRFMKQPADVLRYAAFKSVEKDNTVCKDNPGRDPYQAIALRDGGDFMPSFAMGRAERTFVMDCLADMSRGNGERLSNGMHGHDEEWSIFFSKIHISDRKWDKPKYAEVKKAITIIQGNKKLDRPARRIEEAIKAGDVEKAVDESVKMPGDFMRRFDKLYRMSLGSGKGEKALEAMESVAGKAGIATVSGVIGNLEKRDKDETERYFKGKNGKVVKITEKKLRKGYTPDQINVAVKTAMQGMVERFEGKGDMGKVYISDTLKDVKIPADIREDSASVGSMTSGSKMPIDQSWNRMRFFISWTNMEKNFDGYSGKRVDIDLTAALCDKNMRVIDFCGWNGSKVKEYDGGTAYVYSGDVQDGGSAKGEGRAEYIDFDMDTLKKMGVAYIIPQVSSYTGQLFCNQPNTCFGVMRREKDDMGKTFEPGTVVNRFVLDGEYTQATPYVIDVQNKELLWVNEKTQQNVASRGLDNMLNQIGRAKNSKTMSLYPLIKVNVMANGKEVLSPKDADMVFVRDADEMQNMKDLYGIGEDKFMLSTNKEYITGYLMQDAAAMSKEVKEDKEIEEDEMVL